jgi:DNA-binding winged helix-turn-helix (wHTH) protein
MSDTGRYRFGPFALEPDLRRLLRDSVEIALPPKAFDILVLLVRGRDRVLTKQNLMDVVWPGASVLENTLAQRIREIRKALGDEAREPRYIRTVSRAGYRFVGEVREEPRLSRTAAEAHPQPIASTEPSSTLADGVLASPALVRPGRGAGAYLPRAAAAFLLVALGFLLSHGCRRPGTEPAGLGSLRLHGGRPSHLVTLRGPADPTPFG